MSWDGLTENQAERFWSNVDIKGPDDCWNWTGPIAYRNYGMFYFYQNAEYAQRVAWFLTHGEIPVGHSKHYGPCVLHKCGNTICCNPAHLFLGDRTQSHNDKRKNIEKRFWSRVDVKGDDECWNWTARCKTKFGYGKIRVNGTNMPAHRLSWEMAYGEIPEGEGYHGTCVLHKCDNPACVNPNHLFLGSNKDNTDDRDRKGRGNALRGEDRKNTKLKEWQVKEILTDRSTTGAEFARRYSIGESAVYSIRSGKSWKHINSDERTGGEG